VLKRWLLAQPEVVGALMSGSGATVFAVLRDKNLGSDLSDRIAREFGPDLWICPAESVAPAQLEAAASQPTISLFDRMKDACGIVNSGVPDLASNPRHMDGFGED